MGMYPIPCLLVTAFMVIYVRPWWYLLNPVPYWYPICSIILQAHSLPALHWFVCGCGWVLGYERGADKVLPTSRMLTMGSFSFNWGGGGRFSAVTISTVETCGTLLTLRILPSYGNL